MRSRRSAEKDRVRDLSEGVDLPVLSEEMGTVDPHYWMSAPNAIVMVENARDALDRGGARRRPMASASRAAVLIGRLEDSGSRGPDAHRRDPRRSAQGRDRSRRARLLPRRVRPGVRRIGLSQPRRQRRSERTRHRGARRRDPRRRRARHLRRVGGEPAARRGGGCRDRRATISRRAALRRLARPSGLRRRHAGRDAAPQRAASFTTACWS